MSNTGIRRARLAFAGGLIAALASLSSCSLVSTMAVNSVAGLLAEGEAVFRSDDDLDLVKAPLANNLWLMETMLETSPGHRDMLLSATKGFLLFAYGFVEPDLFQLDFTQFEEKQAVRRRAARLYRRATNYGMRGLEVNHPGIEARLRSHPEAAAAELEVEDAALALWTGTALGAWIAMDTDNPEATADLSLMGALLHRSRELDDTVDDGVVYDYLSIYEVSRIGGSIEEGREYYEHALEIGPERRPVLWSTWAETGSVASGDRQEFETLLRQALDFDIDSEPGSRLVNQVALVRAAWLLDNVEDYFLDDMENQ
ncbi:MAG: TRAP transporter TatT component family protein [Acidobacteria bacterium]|nr:TRAP transporter TatT component family protein [Acidobacteriota bacterium]